MTTENALAKNILLVEDDKSHMEFASQILQNIGCKVFVASSGEEAIEFLKKQQSIDIVLLDLMLPKMNGFEVAKIIREMQIKNILSDMPILAISATQDEQTLEHCLDVGMKGLIPKSLWKPKWEPNIKEQLLSFL